MSDATSAAVLGRFMWYELLTSDPAAAKGFYADLIGWGTTVYDVGEQPYHMWTLGETPVGGVMELPQDAKAAGAPPHWLTYIGTPDLDATVAQARDLGATIHHGPMEIPDVGRFAIVADPQGAVFAAYTSAQPMPEREGPPKAGEFSWHELATTDQAAAFDFYRALFGWDKTEAMDMGPMGTYQMFGRNEETLGGMFTKSAEMPGPPCWLFYTKVPDIQQATAKAQELGGQILNGPMEVPGGDWVVQCADPQGAAFALHATAVG